MRRRVAAILLVAATGLAGCTVGNPYRAEPLDPDIEDAVEANPQTEIRARVDGGLLLVELQRTSRKRWKERPVFRERATSYDPLADSAELFFFPIALVGYVALSPILVPIDAMGKFTSYVDGYPDRRPWAMVQTLSSGIVPGMTTHFYDPGLEAGAPTGEFVRGDWRSDETWVRRPIGGASVDVFAPDGATLGSITTDEAGNGALYLRNLRDTIAPFFGPEPFVRIRVVFGGASQEVPITHEDLQ